MKRSTFITWDQLKVGTAILVALVVMTVAVYKLGQAANLFTRRYRLFAFVGNANGLRAGGSVTIAGQVAGTVRAITFLPPDADTTRNLRVEVEIDRDLQNQIRADSRARLRTLGLLGDKVFDISPGTPKYDRLGDGDTLRMGESLDYEAVLSQASSAVGDMVQLSHDLRDITGGIVRGEGTVGQMVRNRSLYDELTNTLERTNALLVRLQNPNGTVGRMLDDPQLYRNLTAMIASVDTLVRAVSSEQGTVGRLLRDSTTYGHLASVAAGADSVVANIARGRGFAGRMLTDQQLYDQLLKAVTDLNSILADVRRDPRRYTKGMIKVF